MHKFMQTTHKATFLKSIHLYVFEDAHEDGSALINYLSLPDNKLKRHTKQPSKKFYSTSKTIKLQHISAKRWMSMKYSPLTLAKEASCYWKTSTVLFRHHSKIY